MDKRFNRKKELCLSCWKISEKKDVKIYFNSPNFIVHICNKCIETKGDDLIIYCTCGSAFKAYDVISTVKFYFHHLVELKNKKKKDKSIKICKPSYTFMLENNYRDLSEERDKIKWVYPKYTPLLWGANKIKCPFCGQLCVNSHVTTSTSSIPFLPTVRTHNLNCSVRKKIIERCKLEGLPEPDIIPHEESILLIDFEYYKSISNTDRNRKKTSILYNPNSSTVGGLVDLYQDHINNYYWISFILERNNFSYEVLYSNKNNALIHNIIPELKIMVFFDEKPVNKQIITLEESGWWSLLLDTKEILNNADIVEKAFIGLIKKRIIDLQIKKEKEELEMKRLEGQISLMKVIEI